MKIAIVKLSSLGDIVHAMVALQFIKSARPEVEIDWLVEENYAGVLADNPHINTILTLNLKALKKAKHQIFHEINKIRNYATRGYDLVIDAQGLIKSALTARLLSANSLGFDRHSIREGPAAWFYRHTVACPYNANTIHRNLKVLCQPLGIEVTSEQILNKQPFLYFQTPELQLEDYLSTQQPNLLLVIGSTWPSRNYPKEKFLQVVQGLNAHCLICWGNDSERQTAIWIAEHSNAQILPRLTLNDLKALISRVDLLIGNDTGPTHMAWALNQPSITLFGPTPINRVYHTEINRVLKSPSEVDHFKLNKNDFSIAMIDSADVISVAKTLLGK
jgi:heptosyltransferase I